MLKNRMHFLLWQGSKIAGHMLAQSLFWRRCSPIIAESHFGNLGSINLFFAIPFWEKIW